MANGTSIRFDLDVRDALNRRIRPDALVVQEDRNLVMGGAGILDLDSDVGLDAAYLAIAEYRPLPLGRYLLLRSREGQDYWTYQAVVHDFDVRPSSRSGTVRRSLTAILKDAAKRGLSSIALEPLGLVNGGGLTLEEMVEAFGTAILDVGEGLTTGLRLTLLLDRFDLLEEVSHLLRSRVLRKASRSFRTVDGEIALVEVRQHGCKFHFRFVPGTLSGYMLTCVSREI